MKALIQRVTSARVDVGRQCVGQIQQGLLVLIGIEKSDTSAQAKRLVERILSYRVFADINDQMNLSVQEIGGGVLLVPQFTLVADTRKGLRPSFSTAAAPEQAQKYFETCVQIAQSLYSPIETGQFGADMKVTLVNDGPVTFSLEAH